VSERLKLLNEDVEFLDGRWVIATVDMLLFAWTWADRVDFFS
jgi:hypothetical protein